MGKTRPPHTWFGDFEYVMIDVNYNEKKVVEQGYVALDLHMWRKDDDMFWRFLEC